MSHTYHGDGHCRHAPKCIGVGEPDDRDPFGCCNCGTREAEQIPGTNTRPTAGQRGGKDMNEPIQGEALLRALENQKPDPKAIGESMQAQPLGPHVDPIFQARYAAEEARRDVAHAKAMKSGWQTTEFWLSLGLAIGGLSVPLLTIQTMFEQLAVLAPEAKALAIVGVVIGGLAAAAKGVGDYAKARSAVKGAGRLLVALLAVGLAAPAVAAPVRRAVLLEGLDEKAAHLVAVGAGEEAPASPWSLFAVGPGVGVDVRAGRVSPVAELLGTLALTRVFGQVLSLGAGGSLLTGEELRTGFVAGLALDLPGPEGTLRPCLFVGGAFVEGGWGTRIALSFPSLL